MTAARPVSGDGFGELLRTFQRSAFRLEVQPFYAIGEERPEFEEFLAGSPRPPSEISWWKAWLGQIAGLTRQGKVVTRVRVLDEPPTDYQRWMLWADPWYAEAGERISYMTRRRAHEVGLPDADWWLLDDERAVIMAFDDEGRIEQKTLVAGPELMARYRNWRDIALRHATSAEQIAAA